ncbi:MAG: response regulator transcription factor [Magnetococcales bacterium]|nr:response regulator transcription factor [Magnetococcales bacterium]
MKRILLADDHTIFRKGIKLIFDDIEDIEVAGEAKDGDEAYKKMLHDAWDVVLLDISMPGKSVLEVLRAIKKRKPDLNIIMLTMHDDDMVALQFFKAGADGYLTKDCDPDTLVQVVRQVINGHKHITPSQAEKILQNAQSDIMLHDRLSEREKNVFIMLAFGKTVSQIAQELSLSPRTISTYRMRILEKMEMADNAALTIYALKHRLIFYS